MGKTLTESAAEILSASLGVKAATSDPMIGGSQATPLGGASTENPAGDAIGAIASANAAPAPRPGQSAEPETGYEDESEPKKVGDEEEEAEENLHEEEELTEEEINEFLDSLSEEELADLMEELESDDEVLEEETDEDEVEIDQDFLDSLSEEELKELLTQLQEEEEVSYSDDGEEDEIQQPVVQQKTVKEMVEENMQSCKEDIDALFNGESLSEDFKGKATTIFEAAVRSRVESIVESIVEQNEETIAESVEEIRTGLTEQVDEYLTYVVENWMEENKLAIETGLRTEIAEDFMEGLKNLFQEHYIEVPESKVDIVEEMAQMVAEAEQLAEQKDQEMNSLKKSLHESLSREILRKTCEGLTEMQVQRIRALAEGVEFTTEGEYAEKLSVIRENYFPSKSVKSEAPQTVVETVESGTVSNTMDHYVKAISKTLPK